MSHTTPICDTEIDTNEIEKELCKKKSTHSHVRVCGTFPIHTSAAAHSFRHQKEKNKNKIFYLCRNRHKEPERSEAVENKLYLLSIEDHLCKETQQVNCRYTAGILLAVRAGRTGRGCVEQTIHIHDMTHARTENISHHHHHNEYLYSVC